MSVAARAMGSKGFSKGSKSSSSGRGSDIDIISFGVSNDENRETDEERKVLRFKMYVEKITLLPDNRIRVTSEKYFNENKDPSYYTPEKLIFPLSEISTFGRVKKLDFSNLNITEIPEEFLEPSFANHIHTINIENSNLKELPSGIFKFLGLRRLFAGNNQISTLSPEIKKLRILVQLDLKNNKLESLPPEIGDLVYLENLNLEDNKLESLPPEFGGLEDLRYLYLYNNNLSTLPVEFEKLRLFYLGLQNNKFNDIPLRKVFVEIQKTRSITMNVDLRGNNIPPTKLSDFKFELEEGRPKLTSLARDAASKVKNFFSFSGKSKVEPQANQQETLPEQPIEESPEQPVGGKRRKTKTMKKRRTRRIKKSVKKVGGKSRKAKRRTVKK
jgi:Leucine-rich repeat (LRR) protein